MVVSDAVIELRIGDSAANLRPSLSSYHSATAFVRVNGLEFSESLRQRLVEMQATMQGMEARLNNAIQVVKDDEFKKEVKRKALEAERAKALDQAVATARAEAKDVKEKFNVTLSEEMIQKRARQIVFFQATVNAAKKFDAAYGANTQSRG